MRSSRLAVLAVLAAAAGCEGGSLQPTGGHGGTGPGAAGTAGAQPGGAGGAAGQPDGVDGGPPGDPAPACARIAVAPDVFNACGRTYGIAFSPDGRLIATGTATARPNAHLWRLSDGSHVRDVDGIGNAVYDVAFSPDGALLATAGAGDLDTSPGIVKLWSVADGSLVRTIPAHCGSYASTAAFSHDSTLLVTAGSVGPVEVWRVADGSLLASIPYQTSVHNARFSPADREVIVAGVDGRGTIWSLPAGALTMTLEGVADEMADAAYSPGGGEIATTGASNILRLWDAKTGDLLETLPGHATFVSHVVWAGDDRLISNDWSGVVKSWTRVSPGTLTLSGTWTTGGQSLGIAVSPDQKLLVAGGADPANGVEGFVFLPL